jgi:hypothetical protein
LAATLQVLLQSRRLRVTPASPAPQRHCQRPGIFILFFPTCLKPLPISHILPLRRAFVATTKGRRVNETRIRNSGRAHSPSGWTAAIINIDLPAVQNTLNQEIQLYQQTRGLVSPNTLLQVPGVSSLNQQAFLLPGQNGKI